MRKRCRAQQGVIVCFRRTSCLPGLLRTVQTDRMLFLVIAHTLSQRACCVCVTQRRPHLALGLLPRMHGPRPDEAVTSHSMLSGTSSPCLFVQLILISIPQFVCVLNQCSCRSAGTAIGMPHASRSCGGVALCGQCLLPPLQSEVLGATACAAAVFLQNCMYLPSHTLVVMRCRQARRGIWMMCCPSHRQQPGQ